MNYKTLFLLKFTLLSFVLFFLQLTSQAQTPPNENSPLATNLTGVRDYTPIVFVDVFKHSREWIAQHPDSTWGNGGIINTDALGWVTSLEPNQYIETIILGSIWFPGGEYKLFYDGEGTIEFSGNASIIDQSTPGEMTVQVTAPTPNSEEGFWLRILDTDPNNTNNYIRNIRMILPGYENTYDTQPFYPTFLTLFEKFKTIRYMDWEDTNNSDLVSWSDRITPEHNTQAKARGVALEYIIELSNTQQADAWVCIPHEADDNYVTQFATMLRDNLDPNLKIYIEYSNEVWNGQFDQAGYAATQGLNLGLSTNSWEAQNYYYSQRSVEIFNIFESVFGGLNRLERVLAAQNFNVPGAATIMDYNNAYQSADALAIAPYFGGNLGNPATQNEINQFTVDEILDHCEHDIARGMEGIRQQVANASSRNLDLIAYEGGQHLVGYLGAENNVPLENLFIAANRDSRMQDLYLDYYQRWKMAGGKLFAVFSSMVRPSKWGSWAIYEDYDQDPTTSPKYAATMQFIDCNTPDWWNFPEPTPTVSLGTPLIDFQGSNLSTTPTVNRTYAPYPNSGSQTGEMIPFSTADGDHLFDCGTYNQGEFYGGILIDNAPNPPTTPTQMTWYEANGWWGGSGYLMSALGGENIPSEMDLLFMWRKDQFLNNLDAAANVSVGRLELNVTDIFEGGELRFVVRNGTDYYISDYLSYSQGLAALDLFNHSDLATKRWKPFNPTSTDFDLPFPIAQTEPMVFDDVTEVGFLYNAARSSWAHNFGFESFTAYTRPADEVSVTLNQSDTQTDPSGDLSVYFTAQFIEPVTGFASSDVMLSGSAGATMANVSEIAPNDGTTYQIAISGMLQNGSVIVELPENVATSVASGNPNLAATSSDHILQYNMIQYPNVTINQALDQADPSSDEVIYFQVEFDLPVTDFDANDILISGTAGANVVMSVTENGFVNGQSFLVGISGMSQTGTVIANITDGIATHQSGGTNLASTSTDNSVQFVLDVPASTSFIHFLGSNVPDGVTDNRSMTQSADLSYYEIPFSIADGDHIFNTSDNQSEWYGGAKISYPATPSTIGYEFQLRTNDDGFANNRFWASAQAGEFQESDIDVLFLWRKDQFLNNYDLTTVGFDNDVNNSRLSMNVQIGTNLQLRFVVRNGNTYYLSEYEATDVGLAELTQFNNSSATGKRWAVFTPSSNDFALPDITTLSFQAVDFDDVTQVGFVYHAHRDNWSHALEFDQFTAQGISLGVPTPAGVALQASVQLQGAYNSSSQNMNTDLRNNNLLPLAQPFNTSPWNYTGTEAFSNLNDLPSNMVDWVLLEVRDANNAETILEQKAAILLADGTITDVLAPSASVVNFSAISSGQGYYVSIKTRNHLAVLSSNTVNLPNTNPFDFASISNVSGGVTQLHDLGNGTYGLHAGDFNADGVITVSDFNDYQLQASGIFQYFNADANLDGNVTVSDYNLYQTNASLIGVMEIRY